MKGRKTLITVLLALICVLCTAFALGCSDNLTYYTVTFMDGQTQIGEPVKVQKGKKIENYPTATGDDPDDVFDGWYKDEECTKVWNADIERVTKNTTLWANFLNVPAIPSNVAMDGGAFSNTVTWLQRGITTETVFKVEIIGTDVVSGGKDEFAFESYKGHNDIYTVKWTPVQKPMGGVHSVKITYGESGSVTVDDLMFKGAGISANPYLITSQADLTAVNTQDIEEGSYYKLAQSFNARIAANEVEGKVFDGKLNGNGNTVTLDGSDFGLFGALGENAEVKDLTVAGAIANVQTDCVGGIASVNRGKISYCTVSASLESKRGTVGTLSGDKDGIEGGVAGVAGVNYGEISCCTYSGTVKANVGGAGIAVINNGTVSLCSFTGTGGAGNSDEEGNSTKAYSYMGGIVAINYSSVEKSSADVSGKLLAQRGEGGLNDNVGGIVAVNQAGATVSECWFDGIRVHGNKNVGGIVGANAGTVSHCYAGGDYHGGKVKSHSYVGGLGEVGGIVGHSDGGSVTNCFVTSNVYAYSGNAYKVAQSSQNCVYLSDNLDNRSGTVAVKTDEENGNIKIELSGDFAATNYALALTDGQLTALNGAKNAFYDKTNVRLACEDESTETEHTIAVLINGAEIGTVSNLSGNQLSLKEHAPSEIPSGQYFAGWAVSQNGDVVFEANAQVNYAALSAYGSERVTLYPVFISGEKPQSQVLNVALWTRYVQEETAKSLFDAFKSSSYNTDGYEVVYTAITSTKNDAFKVEYDAGEYNVVFAYKSSALNSWQTTIAEIYIYSVSDEAYATLKVGLNSPDNVVAAFGEFLKSDTAKKIMNPAYVSEAEADTIEITLMNGNAQYGGKLTVSNATEAVKATLPVIEDIPAGYVSFSGWTVNETAVENETLLTGAIGYSDVESLATGGKLTLYARFAAGEDPQTKILDIAVYGKFMLDETAESLINTFKTTYAAELDGITVKYTIITKADATNNAAFAAKVLAGDAGDKYDIAIGYKHTTKAPVEVGQTENLTVNMYNKDSATENDARHVCIIGNDESATKFIEFLDTAAAKEILLTKPVEETV